MKLYDRIFPPKVMTLENGKTINESRSRTPLILIVLLVAIIISGEITGFSLSTLLSRGEQFFCYYCPDVSAKVGLYTADMDPAV